VSAFGDTRESIAGKLRAAGVEGVTTDPAALAPFVLVDLITVDRPAGVGAWGASVPVKIVVPPPGDAAAAAALETALELVLRTLGYAPAIPGVYRGAGTTEQPAYTLTYPIDVSNPDC
jgi:hypothetical protein